MKRSQRVERTSAAAVRGYTAGLAEQRHAYYCVLYQDQRFVDDLRILFPSLFPDFSESLSGLRVRSATAPASMIRGDAREENQRYKTISRLTGKLVMNAPSSERKS